MTTAEIIAEFNTIIITAQDYTLAEMKSILSDVYKTKTGKPVGKKTAKVAKNSSDEEDDKPKKKGRPAKAPKLNANGEEKKKREPSAYNIFIKEKYAEYNISHPEMSAKEIMLAAAEDWSAKKATDAEAAPIISEDIVEVAPLEIDEVAPSPVEEDAQVEEKVEEKPRGKASRKAAIGPKVKN